MPRVTIGVPVYNAEALLGECLESLRQQSFCDFAVVVCDNASSDNTAAIAESYERLDPRFSLRRNVSNLGALANFQRALELANTPYFMWRAHDDIAEPRFLEELVELLDKTPAAQLAVPRIENKSLDGTIKRQTPFPARKAGEPDWRYVPRLMAGSSASWFYGLFRTEALKETFPRVLANFPYSVAFDHLVFFPFLITARVTGSNRVTFSKREDNKAKGPRARLLRDPSHMAQLRRDFLRCAFAEIYRMKLKGLHRLSAKLALIPYAKRSYRLSKIWRARMRVLFGEKPVLSADQSSRSDRPPL